MKGKLKPQDMVARTAYSFFVVDMPRLKGKDLRQALRNHICALYPGELEKSLIAVRKNGRKKSSYLVFVFDGRYAGRPLAVPTLFAQALAEKAGPRIIYAGEDYVEYILRRDGAIEKSVVKKRSEETLLRDIREVFGEEAKSITAVCREKDFFAGIPHITWLSPEKEIAKADREKISLFSELSGERKRRRIFLALGALLAFTAAGFALQTWYEGNRAEEERLRLLREQEQRARQEEKTQNERLARLLEEYRDFSSKKKATPFEVAAVMADCLVRGAYVAAVTIREGFFQFEGISGDALGVLKSFESHRQVSLVRLQQVFPSGSSERFTMSGNVLPLLREPDRSLPPEDQIKTLEALLEAHRQRQARLTARSASVFGGTVKELLRKWKCGINSFQYLSSEGGWEIEFSLRAASGNFFSFVEEAGAEENGCEFTLLQIRNLYPRNALEATMRIRTNSLPDQNIFENIGEEVSFASSYPSASRIAENYYTAPRLPPRASVIPPEAVIPARQEKIERPAWIEYLGQVRDEEGREYIYLKDTRSGSIIKCEEGKSSRIGGGGNIEVNIEGVWYEVRG
jgi:hypothetical protein